MSRNQERILLLLAGFTLGVTSLLALANTIINIETTRCC